MELYKDAVCNELREMLKVWEAALTDPTTIPETITRLRLKIMNLALTLDKIEDAEKRA